MSGVDLALTSKVFDLDASDDPVEFCIEQGWTDGLPVVPPTVERVRRFLEAGGRHPSDEVVNYTDRSRTVTVEKVAINAVMAGCRPEYFPVVLALVDAMGDPRFSLHAANASTGGMALGFVVNGPIRNELAMNCRGNVLGPGNRANATIGRALRLTQINAMGSVSGAGNEIDGEGGRPILDRSTIGTPAKYTGYHIPELEEAFPTLEPLHLKYGFTRAQSTVTLFTVSTHIQISAHGERTALEILDTIAHQLVGSGRLRSSGNRVVIVIPPENAEIFVRDGYTKDDIATAIFEQSTRTVAWVKRSGGVIGGGLMHRRGEPVIADDERTDVSIAASPREVDVVIAGGPAGGFIYAVLPYVGGFAIRQIKTSE